jgi:hypothetical protein
MTSNTSSLLIGLPIDRGSHPGRYVVHSVVNHEVGKYNWYTNKAVQGY